jgi:hypothetical protein
VRVFKNKQFVRFAEKEDISDEELTAIVPILEAGQADADLGGKVFKQRIARPGAGKSGGYRIIIFFKSGERTFYYYGFAKSDRGNISRKELENYKKLAQHLFSLKDKQLNALIKKGEFKEITEE